MRGIDEPIVLERGERTSLRQLARLIWSRSSIEDAHDVVGRRSAWSWLGNRRADVCTTEGAWRAGRTVSLSAARLMRRLDCLQPYY